MPKSGEFISFEPPSMNLAKLFGSKCRVKILEKFVLEQVLANNTLGFFIRELCRDIDEQINSVRRELINLEELKILRSKEEHKKKFYFLNKHSCCYQEIVDIFIKNYDPIEPLKEFFKGKKEVELMTISEGLRKINEYPRNSVVDIFIIGEIDKIEFNNFLEKIFYGNKVKYAVMLEKDFIERLEYNDKLVLSILSQKDIIYVKDRLKIEDLVKKKLEALEKSVR